MRERATDTSASDDDNASTNRRRFMVASSERIMARVRESRSVEERGAAAEDREARDRGDGNDERERPGEGAAPEQPARERSERVACAVPRASTALSPAPTAQIVARKSAP